MRHIDDPELVARSQAGDRSALDTLLQRHYDRIYGICRRITGNDADAADATQLALLAIVRGLAKFDGRAAFSTWSYRVATNTCLDELRRRKRRPEPVDDEAHSARHLSDASAGNFERDIVERDALATALAQLPDDFRQPVVLRDVAGLDYAEIAATLHLAPGTVRSRIARGRSKLAELLTAGNQHPAPQRPTDQL